MERDVRRWFQGRILPVTDTIAEAWGIISSGAKKAGRHLTVVDGLIAATALASGLTLVTRNVKDFSGLQLTTMNPWDDE